MKILKKLSILGILLSILFSFNSYAMENIINGDFVRPTPLNESESSTSKWTWISDNSCVKFSAREKESTAHLNKMYGMGLLPQWAENGNDGRTVVKQRYTYSGKWTQAADGIWSFEFDDKTIPVGITKIDGILYAFNGYGELKAEYEYYPGIKTEADGLVKADSAEFSQWLETQYLPECTSHE